MLSITQKAQRRDIRRREYVIYHKNCVEISRKCLVFDLFDWAINFCFCLFVTDLWICVMFRMFCGTSGSSLNSLSVTACLQKVDDHMVVKNRFSTT